jgi:CHASE3 domain sensor protein
MINTKDKAAAAAASARPYVERALRDKELRDNVRNAYTSARAVYDELASRRKVSDAASQLAADKDIQNELRNAIDELRSAANRVKNAKDDAADSARSARNGLLLLIGIVIGLLLNPITGPAFRRVLARQLFGSGNGFVYQGNGSKASSNTP